MGWGGVGEVGIGGEMGRSILPFEGGKERGVCVCVK